MVETTYTVALSFWHPSRSPDEVTTALGIDPHRCWNKGAARNRPDGTPLSGFHRENYWSKALQSQSDEDVRLSRAIDGILDELGLHQAFFEGFRADGGRADLSVYWSIGSLWPEETFSHAMLVKMAALNLDLRLSPVAAEA